MIGLDSMVMHERGEGSKYDTTVTVTSGAGRSQDDFEKKDGDSEDGILPSQDQTILKTVRVSVS